MASRLLFWGFCSGLLRPSPVGHMAVAGPDLRNAGGLSLPPIACAWLEVLPGSARSLFFPSSAVNGLTDPVVHRCTFCQTSGEPGRGVVAVG
ncbi:hypothetical protein BDV59DRAFT_161965 [Aspergillus ambiguus]|uniref:uncharacterized protein n=1 Tax=Aspergillus ambiguus TaxID=176160 RepID=UPI003CCD4D3E